MQDRPILMSAPMVRALLDGSKTQTRRAVNWKRLHKQAGMTYPTQCKLAWYNIIQGWGLGVQDPEGGGSIAAVDCPYGVPGDRLWVRETHHIDTEHNRTFYRADADSDGTVPYLMNGDGGFGGGVANARISKWAPSIFMRRKHSRLTLEITEVRVQRLQEISEEDAIAEGVEKTPDAENLAVDPFRNKPSWRGYLNHARAYRDSAKDSYSSLWESINGKGSWEANPWVWAITFKPVAATHKTQKPVGVEL